MMPVVVTEDLQLQQLMEWIADSRSDQRIEISLAGDAALAVVGLVQMAARHPEISETMNAIAHEFVEMVAQQCPPAIAEIMEAGWNGAERP